ncbi:SDR family NAD(P)-dependent oxidoreductase [Acuticoccus sp. MNP-M23]|uniref:SDR family NAD(P)-dependent oxidoreductase n=1 Tax=Acuticoccus sp. MNP-M23 TaxID=3072793 RepID=UPI002815902F|nr:SDR family NAD(P)-dependent oxidoreductase [Acuticoccus sp. MNP-M23]WMS43042.1 SDR family NAD(P)-dependent oxidoreductase [Acuticoccus sp. MNP-M23]
MADWMDRFSLAGRRALVTGASRGIGAEIARVFADAGADVALVGRDRAALEDTADAVTASGRKALPIAGDLTTAAGADAVAAEVLAAWGTIDILVNCAGIAPVAPALALTAEAFDDTMAVNVRAPFLLSRALAPQMIAQRWGKIINISSQTGVIALADHAAYAASKGALNALTKSLMAEWAPHNIQVNAICPTVVLTEMGREIWGPPEKGEPMLAKTPLGRFGEPVEIADCALYLASPASGLVNGALIMIEGGFSSV